VSISIPEVNTLSEKEFLGRFGSVYEESPHLARRAYEARPFRDLNHMVQIFHGVMYAASEEERWALISAHPDLAGKAAMAGELTAESTGEQASAGLDRLSPEEYEAFTAMNRDYREKFGMPMIVCAREHDKDSILRTARERLDNAPEEEVETALEEISKIAALRLRGLVETDGR
jgi:OHCU decarboxylase